MHIQLSRLLRQAAGAGAPSAGADSVLSSLDMLPGERSGAGNAEALIHASWIALQTGLQL